MAFDERIRQHLASRGALGLAAFWGFAEATLFFIVPDVYLGFAALYSWRRGLIATAFTIVAALVGGLLMYALAARNPDGILALVAAVPLVGESMVAEIGALVNRSGLQTLIVAPFEGVPYKIYAAQAGVQSMPLLPFIGQSILARAIRILPMTLGAGLIGHLLRKTHRWNNRIILGLYALLWIGIYTAYYLRFR